MKTSQIFRISSVVFLLNIIALDVRLSFLSFTDSDPFSGILVIGIILKYIILGIPMVVCLILTLYGDSIAEYAVTITIVLIVAVAETVITVHWFFPLKHDVVTILLLASVWGLTVAETITSVMIIKNKKKSDSIEEGE